MIYVMKQSDGSYMNWGRAWSLFGKRGNGAATHYTGEAAKVLDLLFNIEKKGA